jgi:hypothetical protein
MADVDVSLGMKAQELLTELQAVTTKLRAFAREAETHGNTAGSGFVGGLKKAFGPIGSFFSNIKSIATSTLGTIGIGLGVGAAVHEVKSVIAFGAHIEDLSRKTGVNAEVLSRWGFAAQKAGADVDSLAKFLGFLEVNREKAAKGGTKQLDAFKDLGVSAEDVKNKLLSTEDIALRITRGNLSPDSLKGVGGKGALENRAFLASVGAGAADLDKSLSAEDTAKLKKLEDSFINVKQVLITQLAPAIVNVFDLISKQTTTAGAHIETFTTRVKDAAAITVQLVRVAGAGANITNDPAQFFKELKNLKADSDKLHYDNLQLAPKLLPNPEPTEKLEVPLGTGGSLQLDSGTIADDKKRAAEKGIFSRFGGLVGGEEDAADKKLEGKQDKNDREARKLALDQLGPQERLVELLKEAHELEQEKNNAADGKDKIAAEKNYLDVLKEVASTKKELERGVAQEEKKDAREQAKAEKEHERDLKEEVRERLGTTGRGRGGRGGGGRGVALDAELDRQETLDAAAAKDEADRRARGSYTGPGGVGNAGLVTGHVQGSGGLKTSSLNPLLTDEAFHAQFSRGGGINDRLSKDGLGSLDDFHKQFQRTGGLSRSAEAKKAVDAAASGKKEAVDPLKDGAKLIKESAELLKKALTNQ